MDPSTPRVERTRRGDFHLRLSRQERAILRSLPGQLRAVLGTEDPSLRRLYPPAYEDEPDHQAEYERLVREDLTRERLQALEVVERTVDSSRLTEDELTSWLSALNDLRLVLGTRLDVTEEMYDEGLSQEDPRAPAFAVYLFLGWLEEQVVEALAGEAGPH